MGGKKRSLLGGCCIGIYPGQYEDQETGLYYNWWRYYDFTIGRYLNFDPSLKISTNPNVPYLLEGYLEIPHRFNPFSYVDNNSINYQDPYGLCKWSGTFWIFAISGRGYGGGIAKLKVKSECCMGWRAEGTFNIITGGLSFGIIPYFPQYVNTEIDGMLGPDPPSWKDGNGFFSYLSISAGAGIGRMPRFGESASWIASGDLATTATSTFSGFDFGVDAFFGLANGWGKDYPCPCEEDDLE